MSSGNTTGGSASATPPREHDLRLEYLHTDEIEWLTELVDQQEPEEDAGMSDPVVPLMVCPVRTGGRLLLDGYKRLRYLSRGGMSEIPCCVIRSPLERVNAGVLRIRLNAGRALSLAEQTLFLGFLCRRVGPREYLREAGRLGLNRKAAQRWRSALGGGGRLVSALGKGVLSPETAAYLAALGPTDRDALVGLFEAVHFSHQAQRELVEWIPEAAFSAGSDVQSLLESDEMVKIVENRRINLPQKAERIREYVSALRFPRYQEARKRWRGLTREIAGAGNHVTFSPSPGFEKDRVEVRLSFRDPRDAVRVCGRLAAVPAETWERLMYPFE